MKNPAAIFNGAYTKKKYSYKIFSLSKTPNPLLFLGNPEYQSVQDYIIECENYGIPQSRHRAILLGIREDVYSYNPPILKKYPPISVKKVINELPRLRSGFSKGEDSKKRWVDWITRISNEKWIDILRDSPSLKCIYKQIIRELKNLNCPRKDRGGEFIPCSVNTDYLPDWYIDKRIGGLCNSATRAHIESDLYRYFYAACFSKAKKRSPLLHEFPEELLPDHKNAKKVTGQHAERQRQGYQ